MSTLRVTVERLTIHEHPNADALELAQVGLYRAVVAKGAYKTGDYALYIPEQAVLPADLIEELGLTGRLAGKEKDRVKAIRLRGELSQGIVCRPVALADLWADSAAVGLAETELAGNQRDFADELGITKWVPPIPVGMSGQVEPAPNLLRWIEIENIKRYPDIFEPGEPVIATEKIHGCLHGGTRILMADYTWRKISDLVKEGYRGDVLGRNENGEITPTPVVNTFDNGRTTDWVRIEVDRRGIGRGSASSAVTMTPNHRVWSPVHPKADAEGYVAAEYLRAGDEVWLHRSEVTLSPLAEQVLIGKMLGDGSLGQKSTRSAAVQWGHTAEKRGYVAWAGRMLGSALCNQAVNESYTSGYGAAMARSATVSSCLIWELFEDWTSGETKQVPVSAVEKIGPIALAFWYMDDGSLSHLPDQEDRATFATCAFDEQSIDNLIKALERNGVVGAVKYQASGWRIRLGSDAAERLFLLIAPYVPSCMQYKLPERYRLGEAGFPRVFGEFRPMVRPQVVRSAERVVNGSVGAGRDVSTPRGSIKYDLETGTHNFFANGLLVHNSCCLVTYDADSGMIGGDGTPMGATYVTSKGFGGKNLTLAEDKTNLYWRAAREHGLTPAAALICGYTGSRRAGLFGEVYDKGVQDLHYGKDAGRNETLGYVLFDIAVMDQAGAVRWFSHAEIDALWAVTFGEVGPMVTTPRAPVVYEGPYDYQALAKLAEGRSLLDPGTLREGVVVRPVTERRSEVLGARAIGKIVSEGYLLRGGNATEFE